MRYTYQHPRPSVTVDCVVFGFGEGSLKVLLVERGIAPFEGAWALPGGFVQMEESLEEAARRELAEETGLRNVFMEQLYTFGEPGRDPRGRVISVAWYALVKRADNPPQAGTDARTARWHALDDLPPLAFDHREILGTALRRLRGKVRYEPLGFELLPRQFTLTQFQRLYETILDAPFDKRNFRKKLLGMDLLEDTGEHETNVGHRPARLYRFNKRRYEALKKTGFNFDL